jgi:Xaa-Pro aminopeptidase
LFSIAEKERRFKAADDFISGEGLRGIFIVGNGVVGVRAYGCYRYFVDNRIYYHMQYFIKEAGKEPTVCVGSPTHSKSLSDRGFSDVRIVGDDLLRSAIKILREKGITAGRLGVSLEMLPAGWYMTLKKELPELELVDVAQQIFNIRSTRSEEEVALYRKCSEIADLGYKAVCEATKPGMAEHELWAVLDYTMKKHGAEETFTLLGSGRFSFKDNKLGCLQFSSAPTRIIQKGDNVAFEITPRYQGYWTQIVRTVNVSEPNADAQILHDFICKTIDETVKRLKPGVPLKDVINFMWDYIKDAGYIPSLPCGHICAVDLNEGRVDPGSDVILTDGMAVILHPTVLAPGLDTSIFWGETYLVTPEGGECLMKTSKDLLTV